MSQDPLPLTDVRVLDLSTLMPGPFASQILVDLGATVIKVERSGAGDPLRHLVPPMYASVNRGKLSIELDLKDPDDLACLLGLAGEADVLLEGFRPGVMDRLGLGFEELRRHNERLIYVSLNGYGSTGPLAGDGGHNENFLGRAGALLMSPGPQGPEDRSPIPVADLAGSLYTVIGILAALRPEPRAARQLEIPLLASALALMAPRLAEYAHSEPAQRITMFQRPASGVFPTGGGGYVAVAAIEAHFWQRLCQLIERPDLAQRADLQTYQDRFAHYVEITSAITAAFAGHPRDEVLQQLRDNGIPAGPVLEPEEVPHDEQVRHWGIFQDWPDIHGFLPVFGLGPPAGGEVSALDADAAAVREHGWGATARD